MFTHSEDTPHKCSSCGKGFSQKYHLTRHLKRHERVHGGLFNHIETHSSQVVSKSTDNEAEHSQEISLTKEIHSSAEVNEKARDTLFPNSTITNLPVLHSSDVPYMINIKTEDDM